MRRIVLLLGIAAILVGAWAIRHVREQAAICQSESNYHPGYGASTSCLNQFSYSWLAFGVLVGGIIAIGFALLLMRRERNVKGLRGDRREHLIGTPGADKALVEHYRNRWGSPTTRPSEPTAPTADASAEGGGAPD